MKDLNQTYNVWVEGKKCRLLASKDKKKKIVHKYETEDGEIIKKKYTKNFPF